MITLKYMIDGQDFSRELQPGNYIVGRSKSCDIVISESSISGQHLRIDVQANGEALFRDLLSRNGTLLNGKKAQQGKLANGNSLKLGHVEMSVSSDIIASAARAGDDFSDFAAPPQPASVSPDREFDLALPPEPVDAEFSLAQVENANGNVEVFRPAMATSTPEQDASRKRLPLLLAMLAVAAVFVVVVFVMDKKPKKTVQAVNHKEVYWKAIERGADEFRSGDYTDAVKTWNEADEKLEAATGNDTRVGKTFADIVEPFSQAKQGVEIKDVDWITMRNKLLSMVNESLLSMNLRDFAMELDARVRKEISAGKLYTEAQQAKSRKEWDLAVAKLREISAESLYYLAVLREISAIEQARLNELMEIARAAGVRKDYSEAIKQAEEYINRGGDDKLLRAQLTEWKNRRTVQQELGRLRRLSREAQTANEIDGALTAAKSLNDRFKSDPDVMLQVPGITRDLHERLYVVQLMQMYKAANSEEIAKHLKKPNTPKDNATVKDIQRRWKIVDAEKQKAQKMEATGNIVEATKSWNLIVLTEVDKDNQYNIYAANKLTQYPPEAIGKMMATLALKAINLGKYKDAQSFLAKAASFGTDIKAERDALHKTGNQLFNRGLQLYHEARYSEARESINDARDCFAPDEPFYARIEQIMREYNISPRAPGEKK